MLDMSLSSFLCADFVICTFIYKRKFCRIHFELEDGTTIRKAFSYDWRLWTIPEIRELMVEAGFEETDVYVEGWDEDEDDSDGVFRKRKQFENQSGWVAYVVGVVPD